MDYVPHPPTSATPPDFITGSFHQERNHTWLGAFHSKLSDTPVTMHWSAQPLTCWKTIDQIHPGVPCTWLDCSVFDNTHASPGVCWGNARHQHTSQFHQTMGSFSVPVVEHHSWYYKKYAQASLLQVWRMHFDTLPANKYKRSQKR